MSASIELCTQDSIMITGRGASRQEHKFMTAPSAYVGIKWPAYGLGLAGHH